jgi:hypothetical protein
MPKVIRRRTPPLGWILLLALTGLYGYGLWKKPVVVGGLTLAVAALSYVTTVRVKRHLIGLAQVRQGEDICTFARAFDTRSVDPWVIRAVYEQLQDWLQGEYPSFPLLATDRLVEDLKLDLEDLELDLVREISERTGRSLESTRANPYYEKVQTVADLVSFFCAQPKRAT